ncbi:MAG: GAF domain-containing protein [Reinekea sp.]
MQLNKGFQDVLADINDRLGTDIAIISRVEGNDYMVVQVASTLGTIQPKDRFITCDTYCYEVIKHRETVAHNEVGKIRPMVLHPVYTAMQLEAYIGTPLIVAHQLFGTLNFSGFEVKTPGFGKAEFELVEALAADIEKSIVM